MKLDWGVNQYGSDALLKQDLARVKMVSPGSAVRLDAVNDYLSISNAQSDDAFVVANGQTFVTKTVKSVQLPSPFVVIFRGPMLNPNILNHSLGSDASHRPFLRWDGSLSTGSDLLVIDTKLRTAKHNGVDVDLAAGSTWFDLAANDNILSIGRDASAGDAACSVRHTNPAIRIDWSDLDRRINRVRDAGSFPMLMVPYWPPGENKQQIDNISVMLQHAYFCQQLGIRYKNIKVKGVEFGNEPNLYYVQPGGAEPTIQAKVANLCVPLFPPSWKMCSPGMAPGDDLPEVNSMKARTYLETYWPLCGSQFDFVGIHPYGRMEDIDQPWSVLGAMPGIYNEVTHKPFWCTEYNGPSHHGDELSAQWVASTLPWLNNLRGNDGKKIVPDTFFYAMSDPHTEGTVYPLGVYDGAGHARPVLDVIKNWQKHRSG